ncbi:YdcF family protein [Hydrogenovibrio halophilus]|uniref:YdcF family protein n=1 Tax=Hydrogenovibrio halophilus TaxID=373391 RepID=UPI000378F911|nr:YdcF family protein [Hydrogenovibrio halophilus]
MRLTSSVDQTGVDRDGVFMLLVTLVLIVITLGLSYLYCLTKTYRASRRFPSHCDRPLPIVVPGKQLIEQQPDADYQQRLTRALALWQSTPEQTVWLLGGPNAPQAISEAQAGAHFLMNMVPAIEPCIHLEDRSRNTLENLKQLRSVFQNDDRPLQIRLVSNRYHLARCGAMANALGFETHLIAAETDLLPLSKPFLIEALLYHWYHTGATLSRWLNHPRMLKKIS